MTPERWQRVKELFQSALEAEASRRTTLLEEACSGDASLRRQVEALIAAHEHAPSFLESPTLTVTAPLPGDAVDLLAGQHIGPYEVLREIGRGGMGEVYLAQDKRLGRQVALKFLPAFWQDDPDRRARLITEARAASSLHSPHIAAIHDIGEHEGRGFIVMEYIEGESLSQKVEGGLLALGEAIDIAMQVAEALEEAHGLGIIHRDIKSSNLVVTSRGQVKVLDFGLAKVTQRPAVDEVEEESRLTQPEQTASGIVMGTVHYMSPEQARGLRVDARTDLFSLGVVLYEMVAGRLPFERETSSDVLAAILEHEPEPLAHHRPEVPAELDRIVRKCLEKDRERRYQSARDLLIDLKNLKRDIGSEGRAIGERAARTGGHLRRLTLVAIAVLLLMLIGVGTYRWGWHSQVLDSLAVLPFRNEGADPSMEYLSDGLTESLINSLSQAPRLRVLARGTVFRYKGKEVDPQQVGHDLRVQAAVTGRVRQHGDTLMIAAELIDVEQGTQLWGGQYRRKLADIFATQEEIAREISDKLRLRLTGEEQKRLAKRYTEDPAAYQAYLKGLYYWNKRTEEAFRKAIEYFQQAIEQDPGYALAYAGLADSYNLLGHYQGLPPKEAYPKARAAALRALQIDDTLAEPHTSLARVKSHFEWDWPGAEREYKRAIELNPTYPTAYHWYAYYLATMGRWEEAFAVIQRAQELDPLSLMINATVGEVFYYTRQYDRAIDELRKTIELDPNFAFAHLRLGQAYKEKQLLGEAIAETQKAVTLSGGGSGYYLGLLGNAYAVSGQRVEALRVLGQLKELSQRRYVSPVSFALVYMGLREKDQAFAWLEKAYEERSDQVMGLKRLPEYDSLRSDPRFQDLLRRVGLPL